MQATAKALNSLDDLRDRTLLLKKPQHMVMGCLESSLELRRKLDPCWLAFISTGKYYGNCWKQCLTKT